MSESRVPDLVELEQQFAQICAQLRATVNDTVSPWLERIARHHIGDNVPEAIHSAIVSVAADVDARIERLTAADVDESLSGPLECIRQSIGPFSDALRSAGCIPPHRDMQSTEMRPDDVFDIGPMSFAEVSDELHQAGIAWGAGKAFVHRARRSAE